MNMVSERGIIFNEQMVRPTLSGLKIQTRRHGPSIRDGSTDIELVWIDGKFGVSYKMPRYFWISDDKPCYEFIKCPYGQPGDRLWVRETFFHARETTGNFLYKADQIAQEVIPGKWGKKWSPSIHMPRWASRITLEIVNIRVERLQDISEDDAIKEGVLTLVDPDGSERWSNGFCRAVFKKVWESIYGSGSWSINPWVWVIDFKRIQ